MINLNTLFFFSKAVPLARQLLFSPFSSTTNVMEYVSELRMGQTTVTPLLCLALLISVYFISHLGISRQTNPSHSSVCSAQFISLLEFISCKDNFFFEYLNPFKSSLQEKTNLFVSK